MFGIIRRALLNNLLESKANALKARYANFENELRAEVGTVVEKTTRENTKKLNELVENLNLKLEGDIEFFQGISQPLREFIDLSFKVNLTYEKRKLVNTKKNEISSKIQFLTSDTSQTKKEINELKETRTKLLSTAYLRTYRDLIDCNGITFDNDSNFIEKIKHKINTSVFDDEKQALKKLEDIVRERIYIKKDIVYLEWAIKQKMKHIISNRNEKNMCFDLIKIIKDIIDNINNQINEIEDERLETVDSMKEIIRRQPKKMISALKGLKTKQESFFSEINQIKQQLDDIYSTDESSRSDSDWNRIKVLNNEKAVLKEGYNSKKKKKKIKKLNNNHYEQVKRRWAIFYEILRQYDIKYLPKPKESPDIKGANA
jgi:hypothetical protein